ncbi:hypothetical protein EON64_05635 [archaeon]|nr:MAG: hypothetical protein EON64_05635 [archaeon]
MLICSPYLFLSRQLLSLVLRNVPGVTPFSMQDMGPRAMKIAKVATQLALHSAHMMELAVNHWCCYIDAKRVTEEMLEGTCFVSIAYI